MIKKNLKTVYELYEDFIKNQHPQKPIMHFCDKTITFGEFEKNVESFTYQLIQIGIKPGVKVGYTMPNCPEIFYLFIAIARLGGCIVPLFHMIPDMGKTDIYKKANVQWVITTSGQFQSLKESSNKMDALYKIATIDENAEADYCFTGTISQEVNISDFILKGEGSNLTFLIASSSGTTGIPKLVAMTQANIASEIYASIELGTPIKDDYQEENKSTIAFPLSTAGMITVIGFLFSGTCLVYSSEVSPVKFLELLSTWKTNSMTAPPAFFEAILSLPILHQFDLSNIKTIFSGMDFLSPSLLARLKSKFVNLKSFGNGYGLIETCNVFMVCKASIEEDLNTPTNMMKLVENIGNEVDVRDEEGNSVMLGSEGELYVRGSNVVFGYINNEKESFDSFKDGWFRTGDIARNEGNNTVTLLGRRKYLIKRGGKSISPIVVQNHINKLNGIKNSAVVGVPHQLYGEMIWAFIVKQQGEKVELKDVMKYCRSELANYMVPDQVTFIEDIPKNPGVGKVDFEKLKQLAQAELKKIDGGNHYE